MLKIQFRRSKKNPEIKKELQESIANGKRNKNTDLEKKSNNCTANKEDVAKVIQEFEEIFQKFKEKV